MNSLTYEVQRRIFICGMTRSGKSTLGAYLFSNCPRGIFYDSDDEVDKFEMVLKTSLGVRVRTIEELVVAMQQYPKIVFQPFDYSVVTFEEFNRIIFNLNNMTIFITEISDYCPLHKMPYWFNLVVRKGEKRGIGLIYDSQRTADVHKTPISQASNGIIMFHQDLPNDIDYLKKFCPIAEDARFLANHYFIHYLHGNSITYSPIRL